MSASSSRAEELRAQAALVASRRRSAKADGPPVSGRAKLSDKKISLTVQLQESYYDQLKSWPDRVGLTEQLGRKRIPTVEIMRALVEELLSNTELRDRIMRRMMRNMQ